jgi:hypothetical protein
MMQSNLTLARAAIQHHVEARKRRNAAAMIAGSLFSLLAVAAIAFPLSQEVDQPTQRLALETGQYLTIKR